MLANILSGEEVDSIEPATGDGDFDRLHMSSSDDDSFSEIDKHRQNRQQKANHLIYHESDDEHKPAPVIKSAKAKKSAAKGINLFDMIKDSNNENEDPMDDDTSAPGMEINSEEFNSQAIRRRIAELEDSDDDSDLTGICLSPSLSHTNLSNSSQIQHSNAPETAFIKTKLHIP